MATSVGSTEKQYQNSIHSLYLEEMVEERVRVFARLFKRLVHN